MLLAQQDSFGTHVWRPASDAQELQARQDWYNEVVLDAQAWSKGLPDGVEAVFMLRSGTRENQASARAIHDKFLRAYPQLNAATTPLLIYDPDANPLAPFASAAGEGLPSEELSRS